MEPEKVGIGDGDRDDQAAALSVVGTALACGGLGSSMSLALFSVSTVCLLLGKVYPRSS